jgi:hypothetical protein
MSDYSDVVDINNIDQYNDVEEIDETAMSTDQAPPPPKGVHVAKLTLVKDGIKEGKRVKGVDDGSMGFFFYPEGKLQIMLCIQATIDEEGQPGNGQNIRVWENTMVGRDVKTSGVDSYLRVLTGHAGVGLTNIQKAKKLHDLLKTEPKVRIDLDWEARLVEPEKKENSAGVEKDVYPLVLRGMEKFPSVEVGGVKIYKPLTEDPKTGAECRTKFVIKQLLPLSH